MNEEQNQGPASKRVIAVTFALPEESKDFIAKLTNVRIVRRGSLPVISAEYAGKQIAICHTGVGEESCRTQMTVFLQNTQPDCLVSSGFAGGLDPALHVGDVIVATNFSDSGLLSKTTGMQFARGTMTTQLVVAEKVADKAALAEETKASAVDMETGIISELCAPRGIPMLSMRGISDAAGDDLPVSFTIWFDPSTQKPRVAALLWELALHPLKIPAFAKFVRGISFTRLRLTDALAELIGKI